MQQAKAYFDALNRDYLAVHQAKEDLFWQRYMGTGDETVSLRFAEAVSAWKRFISQSSRLAELRQHIADVEAARLLAKRVTRCCTGYAAGIAFLTAM